MIIYGIIGSKLYKAYAMKLVQILGIILLPLSLFATPLHDAVEDGNLKKVQALIAKGENVNAKNKTYDQTPLQIAAYNEHSSIVKLLIRSGAHIDEKMKNGRTALHIAAFYGDIKTLSYLLRANAKVNTKANDGITPLHRAAEGGDTEAIKMLLANGAVINARSLDYSTPLHIAAYIGNAPAAELLVKRGADLKARNSDGRTPLQEARDAEEIKTIQALESLTSR